MQQSTFQKPGRLFLIGILAAALIVAADQYTKWLVMETMLRMNGDALSFADWFMTRRPLAFFIDQREAYKTIIVTPFLNLVMAWNEGISFGLLGSGQATMKLLVLSGTMLISLCLTIWLCVARRAITAAGLSMVIGGAVGNIFDRIRFGAVADFIDVHAAGFHWPAFNLADSCICVGAILLIIDQLRQPDDKKITL